MKLIQLPDGSWVNPNEIALIKVADKEPSIGYPDRMYPARLWVHLRSDSSRMVFIEYGTDDDAFERAVRDRDVIAAGANKELMRVESIKRIER